MKNGMLNATSYFAWGTEEIPFKETMEQRALKKCKQFFEYQQFTLT
jgi:hypothetical protein